MLKSAHAAGAEGATRRIHWISPAGLAVLAYVAVAAVAAWLFHLPSMQEGGELGWIDCLFLGASAICVTGLVPVADLPGALSFRGEVLLLVLIQLGGLGVVLVAVLLVRAIGRRIGQRHAAALADSYGEASSSTRDFLRHVVGATLGIELAGALFLSWRWRELSDGTWHGLFHSVSAFCNAGFSTFSEGLAARRDDRVACAAIVLLLIGGGIGFQVLAEVVRWFRHRRRKPFVLSLHSRTVLIASGLLLLLGTAALLPSLAGAPGRAGPLTACFDAFFHAASARTAGFNLVDVGGLGRPALLLLCLLMIIGASPGSTGGGIKTVTFVVFCKRVVAQIRGAADVTLLRRALFEPQIRQAVAITSVYMMVLLALILALTIATSAPGARAPDFIAILFESCSALGTVGLSTGITPDLPAAGKLLLVAAMIAGRVGPLTLIFFLGGSTVRSPLRYPRERVFLS